KAEEYLARYLNYRPDDTKVLIRLGTRIDETAGSSPARQFQALSVLEKGLIASPDRIDARRRAARLALSLGIDGVARQHLAILEKTVKDDGELEQLHGRCAEAQGQVTQAADWYEKAIKHAPDQVESYVWLAGLLRRRVEGSDRDRADRLMDAKTV